jgi:hypothetical protein
LKYEKIPDRKACNRGPNDRASVTLLCEVRQGTRPWKPVRLEDISPTGFRTAWLRGCHIDTPLRIRIPGMQVLTAHIRWQQGNAMGCEFSNPLHVAVFEHIVKRSRIGGR